MRLSLPPPRHPSRGTQPRISLEKRTHKRNTRCFSHGAKLRGTCELASIGRPVPNSPALGEGRRQPHCAYSHIPLGRSPMLSTLGGPEAHKTQFTQQDAPGLVTGAHSHTGPHFPPIRWARGRGTHLRSHVWGGDKQPHRAPRVPVTHPYTTEAVPERRHARGPSSRHANAWRGPCPPRAPPLHAAPLWKRGA